MKEKHNWQFELSKNGRRDLITDTIKYLNHLQQKIKLYLINIERAKFQVLFDTRLEHDFMNISLSSTDDMKGLKWIPCLMKYFIQFTD